ncbi:MAG: response regulator transcription factor [Clostridia bacterium]|jgi:DNA-binding response OmpR family regulator|nr:response regulator transcription factor [Clostridia bacterium]MBR0436739.1 response regulator transcription factor [Clostridia bacterium]MBR2644803.1 response regulator transcription factor [Clostridia bacterium]MBR3037103.1 response regulator transcription factor [Clostridia bacterium]MBR3129864.1 response regulator transcription factor [Clostridia bacterium]
MIKILIVDDEEPIANLIRMNLMRQGYNCTCAYDGQQAADLLEKNPFDLVLLDIMLPKFDGYDLLAFIRPMGIPVIFLTAKSDVNDRVKGLKLGAEDYIVKPFEIVELLARIEVVLRRYNKTQSFIQCYDVLIDLEARDVIQNGQHIVLTRKEFDLLVLFAQNPNTALFRESMFERIWETDYVGETRTLDSHVQRLRRKLGWQDRIKTVHKIGYKLEIPEEET